MTEGNHFQKYLFQKIKFFMKFFPIRTNFETTIRQGIYHTKFTNLQMQVCSDLKIIYPMI